MSDPKPKRVLSDDQKAKMKAALAEKRADPAWQAEQKRKREERKAQKDAEKKKSDDDNSSTEKKKRAPPSEEHMAKMKAALAEKRADPAWQAEQKRKREERKAKKAAEKAFEDGDLDDDIEEGTTAEQIKAAAGAARKHKNKKD